MRMKKRFGFVFFVIYLIELSMQQYNNFVWLSDIDCWPLSLSSTAKAGLSVSVSEREREREKESEREIEKEIKA